MNSQKYEIEHIQYTENQFLSVRDQIVALVEGDLALLVTQRVGLESLLNSIRKTLGESDGLSGFDSYLYLREAGNHCRSDLEVVTGWIKLYQSFLDGVRDSTPSGRSIQVRPSIRHSLQRITLGIDRS